MSGRPIVNLADVPLADRGNGGAFAVKWGRIGPVLGLQSLGCALHVVPPGKKAFPFHRHHVMYSTAWANIAGARSGCRSKPVT